jgi:hypothetical protein
LLNLENSGQRPKTIQDFVHHVAKRFLTKVRKIDFKEVFKRLLLILSQKLWLSLFSLPVEPVKPAEPVNKSEKCDFIFNRQTG